MKKKLYQAGMISIMLIFGIVAVSCATVKLEAHGSALQPVEIDQQSNLRIHKEMGITGFNGKPVSWGIARQGRNTTIAIPAGQHTLRFEYFYSDEYVQQQAHNFTFSYEFLPGHDYLIRARMSGRSVVVVVTDRTDKSLSKTIPMRG